MRRRNRRPLARIGLAGSVGALCLALMMVPAQVTATTARAKQQKLTILKQTAWPNVIGRPAVYVDCRECKGTVTLFTNAKKPRKLGSGKFTKSSSDPYGRSLVKLNSRGRKLNKKSKVTVLAKAKVGKKTVQRKIGLRNADSPCDLLKPAEIATVMGEPVDAGVEERSALTKEIDNRQCNFEASAKRPIVTPTLGVSLTRGFGSGGFALLPAFYPGPRDLIPISGVGTKAYFIFIEELNTTGELHAIKGDSYVVISNPGSLAAGYRPDLMPALANLAFARLK